MRSPPQSPSSAFTPSPTGLMDFMSQQSFFFHDDDDETNSQEKSWILSQKQKWSTMIFNRDNAQGIDEPPRLVSKPSKRKKNSLGKSTRDGLKDMFSGIRKVSAGSARGKVIKDCPKCGEVLERGEQTLMVTCCCHADMCYACLQDWDFCEGTCEYV